MRDDQDQAKQLFEIVHQLLIDSSVEFKDRPITLDLSLQRHLGIDSLGRAELFQRIEKSFQVQLPDNLIAEAETLQDVLNAIQESSPQRQIKQSVNTIEKLNASQVDPSNATTLIDVLLLYALSSPDRPHIYLQDESGKEEIISYGKLLDLSLRVASALQKKGLRPGETVAIMQPTNPGFFYTFFGTLLAGCIPVPIYPPFRMHQIESYARQEANILRNAEARMLVTFHEAEKLSRLLRAFIPSLKEITTVDNLLRTEEKASIYPANASDFALIQYTSGSTSLPKGVLLTYQNLLANIRAYGKAIEVKPTDVCVSWVPLYHDLGLIGMWFGSLYYGIPLTLMSPLTFLTRPEKWLWAIHYHRGTVSGGPNFAYELCVKKIEPEMIEGLDLSSWRVAANGAEAIQVKTMERFIEKFSHYGFKAETFLPVYGLAESTVCVSTSPLGRLPLVDRIDRKTFEEKRIANLVDKNVDTKKILEFVSSGKPIPDHEVRVVDEDNQVLPDRHVGQLQFKGPSSMQGYYGNPQATQAIYHDGWWDTGDLAYQANGEIFITGRKKDMIIKAGRNLYPPEIEELTASITGIRKGCIIAFGTTDMERGTEKLIIVAETNVKNSEQRQKMSAQINEKISSTLDIAPDQIILVSPGIIPKTSSGKLQRGACKTAYLTGKLTKKSSPIWFQITKIGLRSGTFRFKQFLTTLGKLIYTSYLSALLALTIVPIWLLVLLLPKKQAALFVKAWARLICTLSFCPITVISNENLKQHRQMIYVSNHTSYVDAFLLIAFLPSDTVMIGKAELLNYTILKSFIKKLGHVVVNRVDVSKSIEDTKAIEDVLRQGSSILIFPEGTFTYGVGIRPFKAGAFKLASETNLPICPIALQGTRFLLRGDDYLFKLSKIKIIISKCFQPLGSTWKDITELKNKVRNEIANNSGEPTLDLITDRIQDRSEKQN